MSIGFCLLLKISIEFYQKKKKKKGRDLRLSQRETKEGQREERDKY